MLRDFVEDFVMLPTQDVYLQSAEQHFGRAHSHCTGVMFLRPTNTARELIEATMGELVKCMATSACTGCGLSAASSPSRGSGGTLPRSTPCGLARMWDENRA